MKIHHLNCMTACPIACRLLFARERFVTHCLLIETAAGLVLVDTGFGTREVTERGKRVGRPYAAMMGPAFDMRETAIEQVRALGFDPADVRHIVVTHLDLDHAGGLVDFPDAQVHVFADEHAAAMARASFMEKGRYLSAQWAHEPKWQLHTVEAGEAWHGFERARPLPGVAPELLIVPVRGHTRGHSAIAVEGDDGWLVHCGDAYFDRRQLTAPDETPRGIRVLEKILAFDNAARAHNLERLRTLADEPGMRLVCAHDPADLPAG